MIAPNAEQTRIAGSVMLGQIRNIYSMPPAHGAAIVARILAQPELTALWQQELTAMRERISQIREQAAQRLVAAASGRDFNFIASQRGMFSFLGIAPAEIDRLREEFGVYLIGSSRANIAGLNPGNLDHFVAAMTALFSR